MAAVSRLPHGHSSNHGNPSHYGSGDSRGSRSPSDTMKGVLSGTSSVEKPLGVDGQPSKRRGPKPDAKPALTRRQELNRQAQRTHRERKEIYVKGLELEVGKLKDLYTQAVSERNRTNLENEKLRALLSANGISYSAELALIGHQPSSSGSFSASYRHTPSQTSGTRSPLQRSGNSPEDDRPRRRRTPATGVDYGQTGIDFVLALEKPCSDHMQMLCVRSHDSEEDVSGHALMATCPPVYHIIQHPETQYPHKLPDLPPVDLVTLLESSSRLPLVDNEITPVMAWSALTKDERFYTLMPHDLEDIQHELLQKIRCYGFGAVLEEFEVFDALELGLSRCSLN